MAKVATAKGVIGVAPFIINPMMVTHGNRTATGVLLKGVDPVAMQTVLDLPKHIIEPEIPKGTPEATRRELVAKNLEQLRRPGAKPPERSTPSSTTTSRHRRRHRRRHPAARHDGRPSPARGDGRHRRTSAHHARGSNRKKYRRP